MILSVGNVQYKQIYKQKVMLVVVLCWRWGGSRNGDSLMSKVFLAAAAAKSLQSCLTLCDPIAHQAPPSLGFSMQEHWSGLPFPYPMQESEKWKRSHSVVSDSCDPMDCSLPGSSVLGIFQARVLECGAIAFSKVFLTEVIKIFKGGASDKECRRCKRLGFDPESGSPPGEGPWRREWQPTLVFLPRESHRGSLLLPWKLKLKPQLLSSSHGWAWRATVHWVAKSWTQLKRLSIA